MSVLERLGPGEPHFDYCLWPYVPPADPRGKLRSATILWHFLDACHAFTPELRACCQRLRAALGPHRTVWGIKKRDGAFSFEFYFYDYDRLERMVSVRRVLDALAPRIACDLADPDGRPYFMFSLDLDDPMLRAGVALNTLTLYIGQPGSSVSAGISYKLDAAGLRLDNLYAFFDAATQREDIFAKTACSAHFDLRRIDLSKILWPRYMSASKTVVVANKQKNDGVYFSRIDVDAFIDFVAQVHFDPCLEAFLRAHRRDFDHLLFDVGFDYVVRDTTVEIIKTAIYGVF